jgi:hypothetical protein
MKQVILSPVLAEGLKRWHGLTLYREPSDCFFPSMKEKDSALSFDLQPVVSALCGSQSWCDSGGTCRSAWLAQYAPLAGHVPFGE